MAVDSLVRSVQSFLEDLEWRFRYVQENTYFDSFVSLESSLQRARIVIDIVDEGFMQCYTIVPVRVPEEKRSRVAEFLTRANYGLKQGAFEMDYNDGEVRYHTYCNCPDDFVPTRAMLRDFLFVGAATVDRYGEALYRVIYSDESPEKLIARVENESNRPEPKPRESEEMLIDRDREKSPVS